MTQVAPVHGQYQPVPGPVRILLVDDHEVVRTAVAGLLSLHPEFTVVGQAADGYGALRQVEELRPEVVLMDVSMPGMSGIEATRRIMSAFPDVKVIGLSMHEADDMTEAMQAAGAVGYVPKSAPAEELLTAVRATFTA